jgi:ornithine carbamoyltransferase
MKAATRVLGRMYDAIENRGSAQEDIQTLAEYADADQAGVPAPL